MSKFSTSTAEYMTPTEPITMTTRKVQQSDGTFRLEPIFDDYARFRRSAPPGYDEDCLCPMCREYRRGIGVSVNGDDEKWQRMLEAEQKKANELKAQLTAVTKQRDEYDTEATNLAKELEQVMTERDELRETLFWYENTELGGR